MATTVPRPSDLDAPAGGLRLDECADEDLARLVGEADEAAFAVLYERHYQALYRYCRSIVRDDLDAQDALQTAWTRALVALRHDRRDAPVRPWLYRIVHNEAISLLRRRRRGPEPTEALAHGDPAAPSVHRAPSAEESVIARERFALLMSDLGQLSDRPRGALVMRELSGLSHEEIAAALETSVAAAKQCVYEARRDLAELAAGRATPCDEICRSISGGDRRALRARRVKAHLSDCPSCASFASAISDRRQALHAAVPWLAAPAAITLLDRVLRSGFGVASSAGAAGAAGGSGVAGGAAGPTAAAGTAGSTAAAGAAGSAAVAGGVVTKVVGTSLLSKAALAVAGLTAGALSLGGVGTTSHVAIHRAPVAHALPAGARWTAAPPAALPTRASMRASRVAATHAFRTAHRHHAAKPSVSRSAGPAKQATRGLPPGLAKRSAGELPPGQAKKMSGSLAPGKARKTSGSPPPGQARKTTGSPPPGQARKTSGSVSPGQANKASSAVPPGQGHKTSSAVAPGQAHSGSGSAAPDQANKTLKSAVAAPATVTSAASASPSSATTEATPAATSPGKSAAAHLK